MLMAATGIGAVGRWLERLLGWQDHARGVVAGFCREATWARTLSGRRRKNASRSGKVLARVIVANSEQKVLEAARIGSIGRDSEHGTLPSGKTDTVTYLLYVSDAWEYMP